MKISNGTRVAVTGGAGFVGVQLVQKLLDRGATVFVLDDFSHGNNTIEHPDVKYLRVNVATHHGCEWGFKGGSVSEDPVDIVFNLAASVAGVMHNIGHHHEMFMDNVLLQTVPVAVADALDIEVFVQVSSVCVYSPLVNHPSSEEVGLVGEPHPSNAGYAWAKRMGEHAISFSKIYRPVIVRPSNVFGPYDYYDDKAHVIPALIRKALFDDTVAVYGDPDTVREFVYSGDVAEGMIAAAENGRRNTAYNLGSSNPENRITMGDLAVEIVEKFANGKPIELHAGRGGGELLRWSNCDMAREELGWEGMTSLSDGLDFIKSSPVFNL